MGVGAHVCNNYWPVCLRGGRGGGGHWDVECKLSTAKLLSMHALRGWPNQILH